MVCSGLLVPAEAIPKGSLPMVLGSLYDATIEQPIRASGRLGLMPIVEHHAKLLSKNTRKVVSLFALARTYSLIYETGTNLVVFDHTPSTTTTASAIHITHWY
jgi:hypothetical protein